MKCREVAGESTENSMHMRHIELAGDSQEEKLAERVFSSLAASTGLSRNYGA